jgi:hypothetical protein
VADCNNYKLRESVQPPFQSRSGVCADDGNDADRASFVAGFAADAEGERQVE